MKKLLLIVVVLLTGMVSHAGPVPSQKTSIYGIHLYFNETEFVDVLTVEKSELGHLTGHMSVPNDFEGAVSDLKIEGVKISFDLFVPKNLARPQDMIFHYEGTFFDVTEMQIIGFVTIKNQPGFVASFTGFLRK